MKNKELLEVMNNQILSLEKDNKRLTEMAFRHEAQIARNKIQPSENKKFRQLIKNIKYNDFMETAVSIFSWENIPETFLDFFNSKRIEKELLKHGKVCIFKHKYKVENEEREELHILPFTPDSASLNCYGEFETIRPYNASGNKDYKYPTLVVNKNCVVLVDYFQFAETNSNNSFTIKAAINLYCDLISDCEMTKIVNRNYLKVPFVFSADEITDKKDAEKLAMSVKSIIEGINDNEECIITDIVKYLKILELKPMYYGKELTECIRDYENELLGFLGIGHINNEKKERMISGEIDNLQDQYNINIVKRLQNREKALKNLKRIFTELANVSIKVNLENYNNKGGEKNEFSDNNAE